MNIPTIYLLGGVVAILDAITGVELRSLLHCTHEVLTAQPPIKLSYVEKVRR